MSQAIEELETTNPPPRRRQAFFLRLLRKNRLAQVGAAFVIVLVFVAIFAPLLTPYSPADVGPLRAPPSSEHWLGTDDGGHDMLTLIMYGLRISLIVGLAAAAVSMLIGGGVGLASGYYGRTVDAVSMRIADFFLVVPELILMVIISKLLAPGLLTMILVIGLLGWSATARVVRAQVKSLRERVYVKRAAAIGATNRRIISRHVFPQAVPLLLANTVLTIAVAIFDETFLAFLGLGDPSSISLGKLIENGFSAGAASRGEWWMIVPPGVVVTMLILGFTLVGQALEDELNPRLKVSFLSVHSWRRGTTEPQEGAR